MFFHWFFTSHLSACRHFLRFRSATRASYESLHHYVRHCSHCTTLPTHGAYLSVFSVALLIITSIGAAIFNSTSVLLSVFCLHSVDACILHYLSILCASLYSAELMWAEVITSTSVLCVLTIPTATRRVQSCLCYACGFVCL